MYLFLAVLGLHCFAWALSAVSGGYSLLQCLGFSLQWLLLMRSTGSGHVALAAVAQVSTVIATPRP